MFHLKRRGNDMDELISKKEVLEKYGISYGALYRWKRMGLIPEAWFLRKSTVKGQETFFRRDQICPRVELILSRKEQTSLEELAEELEGRRQERRRIRRIILQNRFSKQEFLVEDLKLALLTDGEQEISILDYLKEVSL